MDFLSFLFIITIKGINYNEGIWVKTMPLISASKITNLCISFITIIYYQLQFLYYKQMNLLRTWIKDNMHNIFYLGYDVALTSSSCTSIAIWASAFASSLVAELSCCWALVKPSRQAYIKTEEKNRVEKNVSLYKKTNITSSFIENG